MPTTDDHDIWFPDRSTPARDATSTFATLAQSVDDAITTSAEDVIDRLAPQVVPNLDALPEEALLGEKRWVADPGMEVTWAGTKWLTSLAPNVYYAAKATSGTIGGGAENQVPHFTNVVETTGDITTFGDYSYSLPYPGRYRVDANIRVLQINPTTNYIQFGVRRAWDNDWDLSTGAAVTAGNAGSRSAYISEEVVRPANVSNTGIRLLKIGASSMNLGGGSSWIRIRYMGLT